MPTNRRAAQSRSVVAGNPNSKQETTKASQPKLWKPAQFLSPQAHKSEPGHPYAVVILNQPIENVDIFLRVCSQALYIVCADGGANRVKDLNLSGKDEAICKIDAICGDLDSLRPEVEQYYKDSGSRILKDPDQYSTDFTKCLKHLSNAATPQSRHNGKKRKSVSSKLSLAGIFDVAVIGGFGGRADQAFSQMHHLYSACENEDKRFSDIYLIATESIVFLLHQGLNMIHTPVTPDLFGESIGIIPIARPSVITTRGLEWDVEKWPTEFGTQISTSNHIRASHVEIETSEKVLFTVEIDEKLEQKVDSHRAKRRKISHDLDEPNSAAKVVKTATTLITGTESSFTSLENRLNGHAPSVLSADIVKRLDRVENLIDRMVTIHEKTSENQQKEYEANAVVLQMVVENLTKLCKDRDVNKARLTDISQ